MNRLSRWTQGQLNFARETGTLTEEEIDYRTKLATGMTEEEKHQEFVNWFNSLPHQEQEDFNKAFN